MPRYLVAVAGMMGSGKTTLARNVARTLNWSYLPETVVAKEFLNDLFLNPDRWAFDTQVAFLCEKAIQIKKKIQQGKNIILDRSLSEDVDIFAKYFYETGRIDQRSYTIYKSLAEFFREDEIEPDITIYCVTKFEIIQRRLMERGRKMDLLYPQDHLRLIYDEYVQWAGLRAGSLYTIDSGEIDFRSRHAIEGISSEVIAVLSSTEREFTQHQLFQPEIESSSENAATLKFISSPVPNQKFKRISVAASKNTVTPVAPYAYIAAPFTSVAHGPAGGEKKDVSQQELFFQDSPHGGIQKGRYRTALTALAASVNDLGISTLLPHRDINRWGKKILTSKEVFQLCSAQVLSADLFIGVLGTSLGSHYEYGLARASHIPSIIIHCAELKSSFITEGILVEEETIVCRCDRLSELSKILARPDVLNFISKQIGNKKSQ